MHINKAECASVDINFKTKITRAIFVTWAGGRVGDDGGGRGRMNIYSQRIAVSVAS